MARSECYDVVVVGGGIIGLSIAWRAAEAHLTVALVDPSPGRGSSWAAAGMLAQARKRRDIEWVLGDLTSIAWAHEFDLVVMTGHAFQALIEDDELRKSLAAIRLALANNGRFAFETRNPLARAWESWTPENAVEVTGAGGAAVRITTQVETLFDGRTVSFTHTFTSATWTQPRLSRSTLRFLDADLVSSFLTGAGLVIEEQFGNWDRQPLTDMSPEIVSIARPR